MGLKVIRNALSSSVPQIQEVVDFGIVPYLASFISCPNEDLQFEAAWYVRYSALHFFHNNGSL